MELKRQPEYEWQINEQEESVNIIAEKLHKAQIVSFLEKIESDYKTCKKDIYVQVSEIEFKEEKDKTIYNWIEDISQHVFILDAMETEKLPIFTRNHLREEFTVHSIRDLTSEEIDSIQKGENNWFPSRYHPLRYERMARNSLILRHRNELIGWCIVVPATDQLLMYDNLFVKENYQSLARSLSLFWHAVSIQVKQTQIKYLTFVVDGGNKRMLKLLQNKVHMPLVDYQKITVFKWTGQAQ